MYVSRGITASCAMFAQHTTSSVSSSSGGPVGQFLVVSRVVYRRMRVAGLGGRRANMNGYSAQCYPDIKTCVNRHSIADGQASEHRLPDLEASGCPDACSRPFLHYNMRFFRSFYHLLS